MTTMAEMVEMAEVPEIGKRLGRWRRSERNQVPQYALEVMKEDFFLSFFH